jgi:hypothetical protein
MPLGLFEIIFRASGANKVKDDIKDIKDEASSAAPAVEQLAGTMAKLGKVGATVGALGGIFAFGKSALTAAGDAEELNTRLEVITGSAQEAAKIMAKVREVAGPSPFTTKQLANAAVGLQAMGINAQRALPKLADLGAAFGADEEHLRSLVNMMGKINQGMMPDTETLAMFGLGKKDFVEQGITFDKNGALLSSAQDTIEALYRIIDKKAPGMTKRMANLINSQMASIIDAGEKTMIEIGKIIGTGLSMISPSVIKGLDKITEFFAQADKNGSAVQIVLEGIAAALGAITAIRIVEGIVALSKALRGLATAEKLVAMGQMLIAGASGPAGLGKALAGLAGAGLAIWGMESLFRKLESDSASEKKKQESKGLVAPTTINPMTGAINGDGSTTPGHGGLIGTMARVGIGMSKVGEFREEFGKNMADSLAQIAKNTGTTNDLLDLRKQTFGGGALGRLGATAVEMREANGGGGLAAGTGRIPNTLIPYNIDLERGVKKIFAAEYRTQAVNLMRRI